jgi:antitoxin CptB
MDLIMGSFAEVNVPAMDEDALDLYEELLHTSDPDVYDWISGQKPVPANRMNPVIEKLLSHNYADHSPAGHDKS